jgi:hypothetical protein
MTITTIKTPIAREDKEFPPNLEAMLLMLRSGTAVP